MAVLQNKIDFAVIFKVTHANPNARPPYGGWTRHFRTVRRPQEGYRPKSPGKGGVCGVRPRQASIRICERQKGQ
jgi:hypothetical protein